MQAMADNKFWENGDVALTKAWIKDLQSIDYSFPEPRTVRQPANIAPVDVARPTPKHWCGLPLSLNHACNHSVP